MKTPKKLLNQAMILATLLICCLASCQKDCGTKAAACNETPPVEDCTAYFTSWFYDEKENKCTELGYSGCSPAGFETKEECDACKCR